MRIKHNFSSIEEMNDYFRKLNIGYIVSLNINIARLIIFKNNKITHVDYDIVKIGKNGYKLINERVMLSLNV